MAFEGGHDVVFRFRDGAHRRRRRADASVNLVRDHGLNVTRRLLVIIQALAQPFFFPGLLRLDRKSTQLVVLNVGLHLTPGGTSLHREDAARSVSRL